MHTDPDFTRLAPNLTLLGRASGANWADVEAARVTDAPAPAAFRTRSLKLPAGRDQGQARFARLWLAHCIAGAPKPIAPYLPPEAVRKVKLDLARSGIVDPSGFSYGPRRQGPGRVRKGKAVARGVNPSGAFRDPEGRWQAPF